MQSNEQPNRALATIGAAPSIALQLAGDERRLQVLKDVIAKGCTDEELETFALTAQQARLDPFAKQIYAIKRWDGKAQREVLTIQTSIDGFRLIAQRSGRYAGQVGPFWCGPDGVWRDVWLSDEPPAAARVGVRLKGIPEPVWGVAVWKRAAVQQNVYEGKAPNRRLVGVELAPFWKKMGPEMLAVTAERNAIRRACPQDTYGLELAEPDELEAVQANAAEYDRAIGANYEEHRPIEVRPKARNGRGDIVDAESGVVLHEADPDAYDNEPPSIEDPLYARYRRLSELVAEAKKRGLSGEPPLGHSDQDPLEVAISYWQQRIENHDLDQQAERASKQGAF